MRTYNFPKADMEVFVSDDILQDIEHNSRQAFHQPTDEDTAKEILHKVKDLFPNLVEGQFRDYINLYKHRGKRPRIAVLHAHGGSGAQGWDYQDGTQVGLIQDWLNKHDGRYACLACLSCNPGHHTVTTRKSLLYIPDNDVGATTAYVATLIHPTQGEISGYTIDHDLAELRRQR